MSRSTEQTAGQGAETVSSDGMATPYFMLIQMNNASLLEAYATLGIEPCPADIKETKFPAGFSAVKALSPIPFGEKDEAEHTGKIHGPDADPIKEAEQITGGRAADALSLGQKVAARFASNTGDGVISRPCSRPPWPPPACPRSTSTPTWIASVPTVVEVEDYIYDVDLPLDVLPFAKDDMSYPAYVKMCEGLGAEPYAPENPIDVRLDPETLVVSRF